MPETIRTFDDPDVKAVFDSYPSRLRGDLLRLRALILNTAAETEGVGPVCETLKWGQPAYLPLTPRTGSTIRIDALKRQPDRYAMFFHCQTNLVPTFRELYRDQLEFEGNRAIRFSRDAPLPQDVLRHCIALALTYHKKGRPGEGGKAQA